MCKVGDIPHGWFMVIFGTLQEIPTHKMGKGGQTQMDRIALIKVRFSHLGRALLVIE